MKYKTASPGGTASYRNPHDSLTFHKSGEFVRKVYDYKLFSRGEQNNFDFIKPIFLIEGNYRVTEDSIIFQQILFKTGLKTDTLLATPNAYELQGDILILREDIGKKNGKIKYGKIKSKFRRIETKTNSR
ncbi:MAG: hypothetical protein RLO17_23510 [Cyclobacteriaceae bacterium]